MNSSFPNARRNESDPVQLPYAIWLDTATCSITSYRRCSVLDTILCNSCFENPEIVSPIDADTYAGTVRHYLRLGPEEPYLTCFFCNDRVLVTRPYYRCHTCRGVYQDFVDYLSSSHDEPYNHPEPTIIAISQVRF